MKTVFFQIPIEANSIASAKTVIGNCIGSYILDHPDFKILKVEPEVSVEELTKEFLESAKSEDPAVVEKELTYSPTREELDELPDPEFTPGKKE